MLCYRCGSSVPDGALKCSNCGAELGSATRAIRIPKGSLKALRKRRTRQIRAVDMPFAPGQDIAGRYEVQTRLGEGPFGVVFKAFDRDLESEVAIKVFRASVLKTEEDRERLSKAVRNARRVSHRNILRIHDSGEDRDHAFVAMQCVEGLTLQKLISLKKDKGESFTEEELEPLMSQVVAALEHCHKSGFHGSLHAGNVFVADGKVKLTDLFLFEAVAHDVFLGAYGASKWLAPEVKESAAAADRKSDVYSLSAILKEMVGEESASPAVLGLLDQNLSADVSARSEDLTSFLGSLVGAMGAPDEIEELDESSVEEVTEGTLVTPAAAILSVDPLNIETPMDIGEPPPGVTHPEASEEAIVLDGDDDVEVLDADEVAVLSVEDADTEVSSLEEMPSPAEEVPAPEKAEEFKAEEPKEEKKEEAPAIVAAPVSSPENPSASSRSSRKKGRKKGKGRQKGRQNKKPIMKPVAKKEEAPKTASVEEGKKEGKKAAAAVPLPDILSTGSPKPSSSPDKGSQSAANQKKSSAPVPPPQKKEKSRTPIIMLVIGIFLVVGFGILFAFGRDKDKKPTEVAGFGKTEKVQKDDKAKPEEKKPEEKKPEEKKPSEVALADAGTPDAGGKEEPDAQVAAATPDLAEEPAVADKAPETVDEKAAEKNPPAAVADKKPEEKKPEEKAEKPVEVAKVDPPKEEKAPVKETQKEDPKEKLSKAETARREKEAAEKLLREGQTKVDNLFAGKTEDKNTTKTTDKAAPGTDIPAGTPTCPRGMQVVKNRKNTWKPFCVDRYEYPGGGRKPQTGVTWFAADNACRSQGKRLCALSEWRKGCGGKYPWGKTWNPNKCNTEDADELERSVAAAGSFKSCKSRGIYDMVGNVGEWTADKRVAGGDSRSGPKGATCFYASKKSPSSGSPFVGFRCCADPTYK